MTSLSPKFQAYPFSRHRFTDLLQFIAQNAKLRWPSVSRMMTSDVAWQLTGSDPKNNIRIWYQDDTIAGYGWFQPSCSFFYDIKIGQSNAEVLLTKLLVWAEKRRIEFPPGTLPYLNHQSMSEWAEAIRDPKPDNEDVGRVLAIPALETDSSNVEFLERNGFEASNHFEPFLVHDLEVPNVTPPLGITVRAVNEGEFKKFLDTHVEAWAPSSGLNMERYLAARAITDVFDPDLNLVAETNQGKFAACTIFWTDPVSKVGSIEPFGTRPEFRGKGISQAVIYEGLRRLKYKGMQFGRVYTAGFNHQAISLYQSCGFKLKDRSRTFIKRIV